MSWKGCDRFVGFGVGGISHQGIHRSGQPLQAVSGVPSAETP